MSGFDHANVKGDLEPNVDRPRSELFEGYLSFTPLDYRTVHQEDRWEYAIVFAASRWESLHALLTSPQDFFDGLKQTFGSRPLDAQGREYDWNFEKPITINLEPLTAPSQNSIDTMRAVEHLVPGLQTLLNEAGITTTNDFRTRVQSLLLSTKGAPPIHYIAEFAIETRTLRVMYVSRPPLGPRRFQHGITPVTFNVVSDGMQMIHFDIDFHTGSAEASTGTPDQRYASQVRADLVMDYIENPLVIEEIFRDYPGTTFFRAEGPLTPTYASQLTRNQTGAMPWATQSPGPPIQFKPGLDPSVIIDSVWPRPEDAPTQTPNPICILLNASCIDAGEYWICQGGTQIAKSYQLPPGGDGGVVRPPKDGGGHRD